MTYAGVCYTHALVFIFDMSNDNREYKDRHKFRYCEWHFVDNYEFVFDLEDDDDDYEEGEWDEHSGL